MSAFNFDATKVTPQGERAPLPKGKYPVMVTSSELKAAKAPSTGSFINLGMKVLDGPCKDKLAFTNLNVIHSNPVAQQIGQERLSALCHVVGVLVISDTAQLHGRPFMVDLDVSTDNKYNEVISFLRSDGTPAVPVNGAPAGAAPPWVAPGTPPPPAATPPPPPQPPAPPAPTPPPAAPPVPATPPPPQPTYYVANLQGQNLTASPVTAAEIQVMPQGLAQLQICKVGDTVWQPAASLAAGAPAADASTPPWLKPA